MKLLFSSYIGVDGELLLYNIDSWWTIVKQPLLLASVIYICAISHSCMQTNTGTIKLQETEQGREEVICMANIVVSDILYTLSDAVMVLVTGVISVITERHL